MLLDYKDKTDKKTILAKDGNLRLRGSPNTKNTSNKLITGDNYDALKCLLYNHKLKNRIGLVYIDPPFSTKNVFKIGDERASTISSSRLDETAYSDLLTGADYIEFLRKRLVLLRELMSRKASIYVHIDYKIGHYVKIIMDEVFGNKNFRNDITRVKCSPKNFKRRAYGNIKDMVLFYTKSNRYTWNEPRTTIAEEDIKKLFSKVDNKGRHYTTIPLHAPGETEHGSTGQAWKGVKPPKGRHWRSNQKVLDQLDEQGLVEWSSRGNPRKIIYADDAKRNGKKVQDIWKFKDPMYPTYPTEKNDRFLELIISASSNPGDLVLDCFCGSGTTLLAAHKLKRNWIGIDSSKKAIASTVKKMSKVDRTLFESAPKYGSFELESVRGHNT